MVRFIIDEDFLSVYTKTGIYIPIWLDLLYNREDASFLIKSYLHSNMVRFIMA